MENKQKQELRKIIKSIPKEELKESVSILWRRYSKGDFNYQTFRNYFKALVKEVDDEQVKSAMQKGAAIS